jgi:hypothetical protein
MPYTREVKVPVKTRRIVPTRVQKKVRTTKLVEVPAFKMVDETYTEVCKCTAVTQLSDYANTILTVCESTAVILCEYNTDIMQKHFFYTRW